MQRELYSSSLQAACSDRPARKHRGKRIVRGFIDFTVVLHSRQTAIRMLKRSPARLCLQCTRIYPHSARLVKSKAARRLPPRSTRGLEREGMGETTKLDLRVIAKLRTELLRSALDEVAAHLSRRELQQGCYINIPYQYLVSASA